jgi:hypothetical protein
MRRFHRLSLLLSPVLISALCQPAWAFQPGCNTCAPCCQTTYKTVERTVMVPTMVTENRTVDVVECRAEQRQHTYTVHRPVAETQTIACQITVPTYETRTQTVNYTVCRPVMTTQQREYTVMVPQTETRQATRPVCRMVPTTQTRTVCEDQGSWQQVVQTYKVGCGDCAQTCSRTCNVWAPKMVTREVEYTVMRPQIDQVPYQYTVTVCHPETRTQDVQVCSFFQEAQSREVQYTVCVPQQKTITREVVTCKLVAEQRTANYTVQVPYTVQKQVAVQVCKMVPKTITCQVPVCETGCQ